MKSLIIVFLRRKLQVFVIPAKAGIQVENLDQNKVYSLDSGLRRNDDLDGRKRPRCPATRLMGNDQFRNDDIFGCGQAAL